MQPLTDSLDAARIADLEQLGAEVREIGRSTGGRPLHGVCIGDPAAPLVSIVAGAHPDEPAGPLAALELLTGWAETELAWQVRLAVIPLLDPDGVVAQKPWLENWEEHVDLPRYLMHRLRREPGDDREFARRLQAHIVKPEIDPDDIQKRPADDRGRVYLGPEYADKTVEVVVLND